MQCRADTAESARAIRLVSSRPIETSRSLRGRATPASEPPIAFKLANIPPLYISGHYPNSVCLSDRIGSVVLAGDLDRRREGDSPSEFQSFCTIAPRGGAATVAGTAIAPDDSTGRKRTWSRKASSTGIGWRK